MSDSGQAIDQALTDLSNNAAAALSVQEAVEAAVASGVDPEKAVQNVVEQAVVDTIVDTAINEAFKEVFYAFENEHFRLKSLVIKKQLGRTLGQGSCHIRLILCN